VFSERSPVSSDDGVSVGSNIVDVDGVGSCRSWLTRVFITLELLNSLPTTLAKFATKRGGKRMIIYTSWFYTLAFVIILLYAYIESYGVSKYTIPCTSQHSSSH